MSKFKLITLKNGKQKTCDNCYLKRELTDIRHGNQVCQECLIDIIEYSKERK